jgi:mono/diheme cytochrome c family protein
VVVRPVLGAVAAVVLSAMMFANAASGQEGDPDEGSRVYRQSCAMCHGGDATGMMGMHPALTGAVDRLTVEGVEVTVRNGRATTPPMPAFVDRLNDEEIADVVAFVASLPDGPRNFGPDEDGGMGDGMMGGMMDGGPSWMWVVIVVLAAALAGVVGYLIGVRRSRS